MKGTVVFDFDDTLADTASFKRALATAAEADAVVDRMAEFVFPGALEVLDRLKAEGWKLALLTFGDVDWQRRKLTRSGLLPFFDYVVYTPEPKETRAAEFLAWPAPLIFVNDHGGELDALKRTLPEARMVAVRGKKPLPTHPETPLCEDLAGVYRIVAQA